MKQVVQIGVQYTFKHDNRTVTQSFLLDIPKGLLASDVARDFKDRINALHQKDPTRPPMHVSGWHTRMTTTISEALNQLDSDRA